MVNRVSMSPSWHGGKRAKSRRMMQGHAVAEGVVPGGVDRLNGDTQLADCGRHQDLPRRGGECLAVDDHRAGGHALTGQAELAPQVVVGDPPPPRLHSAQPIVVGTLRIGSLGAARRLHQRRRRQYP